MGSSRSAASLVVTSLALAVVPSALLSAGVSAAAATCGSLNRGTGAPAAAGELAGTSFVSASQTWAVGDLSYQGRANRTLTER
jgi:hypothetical protein